MILLYIDKTFDEAMAKRGYINTVIRNEKDQKIICWANIFLFCFTSVLPTVFLLACWANDNRRF